MVQSKLNNCISQTRSALFRASDCERPRSTRLTVLHQLVDGPPLFEVLGCTIEKFDTFDVCVEQLLELLQSPSIADVQSPQGMPREFAANTNWFKILR